MTVFTWGYGIPFCRFLCVVGLIDDSSFRSVLTFLCWCVELSVPGDTSTALEKFWSWAPVWAGTDSDSGGEVRKVRGKL